jgi:hypothetical protein
MTWSKRNVTMAHSRAVELARRPAPSIYVG